MSAVPELAPYPTLLSPIQVGTHLLKNRVIMGSMHTRLEHLDDHFRREAAFYGERARGGVALIITGGFSPNEAGRLEAGAPILSTGEEAQNLAHITRAVHDGGGRILLQILHAGRYAKHDHIVGVSEIRSPINPRSPRALTEEEIEATIEDFVRCAALAAEAGYDGVEIMGSEGYLITQFVAKRTNNRTDQWGGTVKNRCRFAVEIVRRIRAERGADFIIMFRLSALDLVDGGSSAADIDYLAKAVQKAGADIINTGFGWHEAPVPTIAYHVPRAAWLFAAARVKKAVSIPVIGSNRINTPELAEQILASGDVDMISMARPMLADPQFVLKAAAGKSDEINPCIACNQACLDHIFTDRVATCLVNPKACRETEFDETPPAVRKRVAVIGSGPAGLSFAANAAARGHEVVLYEADRETGGQLNLARRIPGKQEFDGLLAYLRRQLEVHGVDVRVNVRATPATIKQGHFDRVICASGIVPRTPVISGMHHPKVVSYIDLISGRKPAGERVAIIGTGGIGHDVAEWLLDGHDAVDAAAFYREWGVDPELAKPGGLAEATTPAMTREIALFQRSETRVGERLGKSTGWILRSKLKKRGVQAYAGCQYDRIDDAGLHYTVNGESRTFACDTVVICAGQEPAQDLARQLQALHVPVDLIGGARLAGELDAKRAIDEGTRLAYSI
jgi:2,4-dienoyl-CoA reductase (NADPH2)